MSLQKKLAGLSPRANDIALAEIWTGFYGSEAHQLLSNVLAEINAEAKSLLLDPHTEPYARAHAAGQVMALERVQASIKAGAAFDPAAAEYDLPDDEDNFPDDQQRI